MQSVHQSKIENMAARIYETGHTYHPGDEVEWLMPSAYASASTIQKREVANAEDCAEAEDLVSQWRARRASEARSPLF